MKRKYKVNKEYKPYKGFYDLRDFDIPVKEFKKLWDVQDILSHMTERREYFKKFLPFQWERAKEVSACYQQALFSYKQVIK